MNTQERQLVDELFQRLAALENAPRDRDAETAIGEGVRRAPHALFALVQTVLVQDEALKQADARIQELENGAGEQRQSGGFLDNMRDALMGGGNRGSVPSVGGGRDKWNSGQVMQQSAPGFGAPPQQQASPVGGGGSFLGTAAAAAAGMVGGSLLLNGIRGMMGGGTQQSFGDTGGSRSPWGGDGQSDNPLAQQAGVNDMGHRGSVEDRRPANDRNDYFADDGNKNSNQGANDHASLDNEDDDDGDFDSDFDGGGDSDFA